MKLHERLIEIATPWAEGRTTARPLNRLCLVVLDSIMHRC